MKSGRRVLYVIANEHILDGGIFYSQVQNVLKEISRLDPGTFFSILYFAPVLHWARHRRQLHELTAQLGQAGIELSVWPVPFRSLWVRAAALPVFLGLTLPILLGTAFMKRPQILHCRSYPAALVGLVAKRLLGIKLIFDMRGLYVDEGALKDPAWDRRTLNYRLWKRLEKVLLAQADRVIVVSRPFAQQVKAILPRSVTVIPCVASAGRGGEKVISATGETGIPDGGRQEIRVVYSGSLGNWTTVDDVARAFQLIKQVIPSAVLRVLTQSDQDRTSAEITAAGVRSEDFEVRSLPPGDVHSYLALCDIGLIIRRPSIVNTVAFPVKFAEYLLAGLPVIVNPAASAVAALVEELRIGAVVDPSEAGEAVRSLRRFWQRFKVIQNNCQLAKAGFSTEAAALEYGSVYAQFAQNLQEERWI